MSDPTFCRRVEEFDGQFQQALQSPFVPSGPRSDAERIVMDSTVYDELIATHLVVPREGLQQRIVEALYRALLKEGTAGFPRAALLRRAAEVVRELEGGQ